MTRLEWPGMQLAFRDLLRITHGEAAVLTAIVKKTPHVARYRELELLSYRAAYHRGAQAPPESELAKVHVHSIRSGLSMITTALRNAGAEAGIEFEIINHRNEGYSIAPAMAARLIDLAKRNLDGGPSLVPAVDSKLALLLRQRPGLSVTEISAAMALPYGSTYHLVSDSVAAGVVVVSRGADKANRYSLSGRRAQG